VVLHSGNLSTELLVLASGVFSKCFYEGGVTGDFEQMSRKRLRLSTRPFVDFFDIRVDHPGQDKSRALCPHSGDGDTMRQRSIAYM
jgi:hypothetical protein